MTFDNAYNLTAAGTFNAEGLTLYEATKRLDAAAAGGAVNDATHIRRDGRAVGFFCGWRAVVRPMFQATPSEAHILDTWSR